MDTWELDNPTEEQVSFLKEYIRGLGTVERIDERFVNVTVHPEATDDIVQYCEDNSIECRLI